MKSVTRSILIFLIRLASTVSLRVTGTHGFCHPHRLDTEPGPHKLPQI